MPNHCANRLTVTGPEADIAGFRAQAKSSDEKVFDVNRFVPMPPLLRNTGSGSRTFEGDPKIHHVWLQTGEFGTPEHVERPLTDEENAELKAIGHASWYDWACAIWGTKWGAYETRIVEETPVRMVYRFQTAWGPLSADCLASISEAFPPLLLVMEYAESGGGFYGSTTAKDGVLLDESYGDLHSVAVDGIESTDQDYLSSVGYELAAEVLSERGVL